jgi:hypothetical protein
MNSNTRDIITDFVQNNANIRKILNLDNTFLEYMQKFRYASRTAKDTFFKYTTNLLEWYKRKNPEFKNIAEINFQMPEFTTLLQTIVLFLCKILYDGKFPGKRLLANYPTENNNIADLKDNSSYRLYNRKPNDTEVREIIKILDTIETIGDDREYKSITKVYLDFIKLVSGLYDEDYLDIHYQQGKICNDFVDFIYKMFDTPLIFYPTFNQLDYKYVLNTLSAPIINFLISYTRFYSHDKFLLPCWHLNHDAMFHGYVTHFSNLGQYTNAGIKYQSYVNFNERMNFYFPRQIKQADSRITNSALLKIYIDILEPLIKHILSVLEADNIDDSIKHFLKVYFFILLHEVAIDLKDKYSDLPTYIELLRKTIVDNKEFITEQLNEEFNVPDDDSYMNYNAGLEYFNQIFPVSPAVSNGGGRKKKYSKKTKKHSG